MSHSLSPISGGPRGGRGVPVYPPSFFLEKNEFYTGKNEFCNRRLGQSDGTPPVLEHLAHHCPTSCFFYHLHNTDIKVFFVRYTNKTKIKLRMDTLFRLIWNNICGEFFLIFHFQLIFAFVAPTIFIASCHYGTSKGYKLCYIFSHLALALMVKQLFPPYVSSIHYPMVWCSAVDGGAALEYVVIAGSSNCTAEKFRKSMQKLQIRIALEQNAKPCYETDNANTKHIQK